MHGHEFCGVGLHRRAASMEEHDLALGGAGAAAKPVQ